MRRSSRFNRPGLTGSSRSALLLNNDGDGSTLTLDFTTGSLDPRLTFTRGSNATFINSSGFVEWSASNHAPRTNWNFTSPTGSGWNAATVSGTGTFQWVGNGTVIAASGSAGQAFTIITTPTGIAEGLRYVMSVTASSVTGSPTIQSIFDFTSASGNTYFKNGAAATAGTTVASGDRISVSAIASSTSMNVRLGCGAWFANRTNESVTLTQFHWHPGSAPVAYYENTGTSPRYDSARFDYDPTTLAPRGLLIEGQATNLVLNSADFTAASWGNDNTTDSANTITAPDGTVSADTITDTATTNFHAIYQQSSSQSTTATYTMSCFIKKGTVRYVVLSQQMSAANYWGVQVDMDNPTSGGLTTAAAGTGTSVASATITNVGNGWYRVAVTGIGNDVTHYPSIAHRSTAWTSGGLWQSYAGSTANFTYVWGFQYEQQAGASSYIPTGASQATRNADNCTMNDITALNYSTTNGTMLYVGRFTQINSVSYPTRAGFQQAGGNNPAFEIFTSGSLIYSAARSASANPERSTTITTNSSIKFATAFDASLASNEVTICLNGGTVLGSSATGLTATYTPTIFALGRAGFDLYYPSGTIAQVKYWPTTLPNAQLQSITT